MELIDNLNALLGDDLRRSIQPGAKLRIAASCFSIYAFEALRAELEKIDSLEFIFTSPTFIPHEVTDSGKKTTREYFIPKAERERSVYGTEFEIQLKNKLTQRAIAKECADWMRRKARFRSNRTKAPMQAFACVSNDDPSPKPTVAASAADSNDAVYMPLHGFTAVDLGYQKGDAVSNFVHKFDDSPTAQNYLGLFDQIWGDTERIEEVTDRLCEHIASIYQENAPERIYFQMLYNIFNEFLEDISDDTLPNDMTGYQDTLVWNKLFNFQRDAATGIINKLETFNGCILADSVGLGKTFTALAVIKYYELRNRSVLVLCPKKLSDNWLTFNRNVKTNLFAKDRFNYDVLCHTDLQRTSGVAFGTRLDQVNWGNYDLVVIDESHNFRNAEAFAEKETRYDRLMNAVIRAGVQTKVLMLSATPVNNRFNDLKNQLALAYEGDQEAINRKLETAHDISEIFRRAQTAFNAWTKLPAKDRTSEAILKSLDFDFFKLLDSVTIARSRRHIQTFYDTSEVGSFPTRLPPKSFRCPLTHRGDVPNLNEIYHSLSSLKLAVYAPVAYIHPSRLPYYAEQYDTKVEGGTKFRQIDRERSLQNLMTVNLLKRLESSIEAFRITLTKLQRSHRGLLEKIEDFQRTGVSSNVADAGVGYGDYDEDDVLDPDAVTTGKIQIRLNDMDLPSWQADLEHDVQIIDELLAEMKKVTPKDDAKLQNLLAYIRDKFESPMNPGNRKILIFTAFADTSEYLYEHVAPAVAALADEQAGTIDHQGGHTATVSGTFPPRSTIVDSSGRPSRYDFQSLLTLFSPRSKEKALVLPDEPAEIDVLIGTDCISEGQNLQDCDCVINYDIHWNPVRIIQRFGRVDRIGSPNECIQLVNYWPDITLDEYINLKERVEDRMVIADMTATGDDNVLLNDSGASNEVAYRKEQLRRLQDEVIEMEDVKTGVSITDLGLNDFRMDLLAYVKESGDLANIPNGMHSVVPADPDRGLLPGVIFTLRNRQLHPTQIDASVGSSNRLHPYYLVYVASDGSVVVDHTEVKRLLDLARVACRGRKTHVEEVCKPFNDSTDDGRNMGVYSDLLDTAIGSIIDCKQHSVVDSLFSAGTTTALVGDINGLDDFELITFLVIYDPPGTAGSGQVG
ncbi:MAG: SNF2-related protein [bacterium]|nr:SNF2-related protein [bacterium]